MIRQIEQIYKRIKKLTKGQKKILSLSLLVLLFLFSLMHFVYAPQRRKFTALKKELSDTEAQISVILAMAQGRPLAEAITELKDNFMEALGKLPAQDEAVMYHLSEGAKRLNLEVKNIISSGKRILEGEISGYQIEEMPISLSISSEYRALGEYLSRLRNDFPVLIRIGQVGIKGHGEGRLDLEVKLQIYAYLAKEIK